MMGKADRALYLASRGGCLSLLGFGFAVLVYVCSEGVHPLLEITRSTLHDSTAIVSTSVPVQRVCMCLSMRSRQIML